MALLGGGGDEKSCVVGLIFKVDYSWQWCNMLVIRVIGG